MKPVSQMNGTERAAALLVALGPEIAAEILKHLDEDSIDRISTAMAGIDRISPEDREELSGEFLLELRRRRGQVEGGENKAREILRDAFGPERAEEVLSKVTRVNIRDEFDFMKEMEPEILAGFLKEEHPQTIAVTLSLLPPQKSASILTHIPADISRNVALRMARMKGLSPDAAVGIARALKKRYREFIEKGQQKEKAGGLDSLLEIMNHMNAEGENRLMRVFDNQNPGLASKLRERVFSFENIINLTNIEVRILVDEVNNDHVVAQALKGAGDDIRFKIVRNMSQNRATDLVNEMNSMGPIRLSEVEEARGYIVSIMRTLNDNGVISLRRENEIYVE